VFNKKQAAKFIPLSLCLLLAAFFRLSSLPEKFIDLDECFSLFTISQPTFQLFLDSLKQHGPHQPLLDYLIGFAAGRFSTSLSTLRLISVFWGLLSVACLYWLGRCLWKKQLGLMAAFLLALAVIHIDASQTFRHYSLIVFLSLLSIVLFFRQLESEKGIIPYSLTMVLYHLAYPFALVKGLVDLGFVWRFHPSLRRRFLLALSPSWIFFLGWYFGKSENILSGNIFSYAPPRRRDPRYIW